LFLLLSRQLKIYAPQIVGVDGRRQIQLRDGNFAGPLFSEHPQRLPNNGVILEFLDFMIAIQDHGFRGWRLWRGISRRVRLPLGTQARHFVIQSIDLALLDVGNNSARVVGRRINIGRVRL
jgi:hypothetical protein